MKANKQISKLVASAAMAVASIAPSFAQTDLGAACGCPSVPSRTTVVNMSSLPGYVAINGTYGGELTQGATLTCDKIYVLDKKIYIPSGQVLNIAPGTLIKAMPNAVPAEATALVIERGGKINADGLADCQIVFTANADNLDGSYPISNKGMWGGVVVLGKATNNLKLANNGPFVVGGAGKLAVADGLGTIEGFASSNPQDQYGVQTTVPANLASATSPATSTYTFALSLGTQSGTGALGNSKIIFSGLSNYVLAGMTITGAGIPVGTTVTGVSGQTVTFSQALTAAATGNYTFTGTYPLAPSTTGQFYTVVSTPAFAAGFGPFDVSGGLINFAAPYAATGGAGTFDDNDNSGVMRYVSIRHSGAILAVGAEINGLTLGSVGRGTTIEHIEIVSCADDNIEFFGGTVNVKYVSTLFGNDDMFDYDCGWTGKGQFLFGMKTDVNASADSDNGFEADSDDDKSNALPRSTPVFYNVTLVGNAKNALTSDNSSIAAINAKELTGGEFNNSVFAYFKNGFNMIKSAGSRPKIDNADPIAYESYHNWSTANGNGSNILKLKCNTFVGCTNPITIASSRANLVAADITQFTTTDKNDTLVGNTLPGFDYVFTVNSYLDNTISHKNDVVPNPALSVVGCPTPPVDGFFRAAAYRGAFSSDAKQNWLSDWSYSKMLGTTKGLVSCPTDINGDGSTNVNDFLIFGPAFNTTCN